MPLVPAERQSWMDAVRGTAILLVVLFHSATLLRYANAVAPAGLTAVNQALSPFRIPALVFLSGLLLPRSLAKPAGPYFVGKARNIAWPFLVWSIIFMLAMRWVPPAVFWVGGSYLWYLAFLVAFYVAAWVLRPVPAWLVVVVALTIAVVGPDGSKYVERLFFLFAIFMVGSRAAEWEAWPRWSRSWWTLAVAGCALLLAELFLPGYSYGPTSLLTTAFGVAVAVVLARRFGDISVLRPIRFVGRHSLVFYVSHFPTIYVLMLVARRTGIDDGLLLVSLAATVAVTVGVALSHLRSRPAVGWLFVAPVVPRPARHRRTRPRGSTS